MKNAEDAIKILLSPPEECTDDERIKACLSLVAYTKAFMMCKNVAEKEGQVSKEVMEMSEALNLGNMDIVYAELSEVKKRMENKPVGRNRNRKDDDTNNKFFM